jgi:hypothetical protein
MIFPNNPSSIYDSLTIIIGKITIYYGMLKSMPRSRYISNKKWYRATDHGKSIERKRRSEIVRSTVE